VIELDSPIGCGSDGGAANPPRPARGLQRKGLHAASKSLGGTRMRCPSLLEE